MTEIDVATTLRRLDRIEKAVQLGCTMDTGARPVMRRALDETAEEAVRLCLRLTQALAYDEFWTALPALVERWIRVESTCVKVVLHEPGAQRNVDLAGEVRLSLRRVLTAASAIDEAAVELRAHPRDRRIAARLAVAIRDLEAAADQHFMAALSSDRAGHVDAAMAVLTACAARASRERMAARTRPGA